MRELISIKGGKEGLRLQLDEAAEWAHVLLALREHLDQGGSFFAGARLLVDVGGRALSEDQLAAVLALMEQHNLRPELLAATTRESRNVARAAGLHTRMATDTTLKAAGVETQGDALLLRRTVRSGQVVQHHGSITLIGDVNAGAELIAGGSVVVWGRLRGLVHAGALGDNSAAICALELRPTQLRIASLIARTPEGAAAAAPEVARIEDNHIIVEAWEFSRR
jgi:septum site-determining protein MinC